MRYFLALVLLAAVASEAAAAGGTRIRFGRFATTVRAGCGANVCASPCGAKVTYGGGYGGSGCASGYCGGGACGGGGCQPVVTPYQGGGCATGTCAYAGGGSPFGVNCQPNYGTHTQTCTESFQPYGQATFAGPQFIPTPAPLEGAIRYRGY